ncbi:MAG: stress-responsive transcriptional regulator PspC [Eubacterium aggregans]|uniref:Stress-responsive transcriptional regulator PspC n=1 Tax=Eubacterium aggregans TaxID=81409 RepID=A0A1H3ZQE4_9FIRM|nr:stress-responsive transcriptional regulator PspC [Eubacterium aggregans]MEA5073917.1 stress-responsive transcriptional regulator PspC [Eubacterium aggregans]SEA25929.1 hypothetical protein SAMN04515656_10694 [Eubacterium aggregans]
MDNECIFKKIMLTLGTIVAGVATGFGVAYLVEKRREEAVGGKLMRVNYRFTKDFDG